MKPASKIKNIINLTIWTELVLRMEGRSIEILCEFKVLNNNKHWVVREGQSNKICERSQMLSLWCKVQNGESFKLSLYAWAGNNECPIRKRLN